MKILDIKDIASVAGGADLYVTQQISTDGISETCINTFDQSFKDLVAGITTKEELEKGILCACSTIEIEIIVDRFKKTTPSQVIVQ